MLWLIGAASLFNQSSDSYLSVWTLTFEGCKKRGLNTVLTFFIPLLHVCKNSIYLQLPDRSSYPTFVPPFPPPQHSSAANRCDKVLQKHVSHVTRGLLLWTAVYSLHAQVFSSGLVTQWLTNIFEFFIYFLKCWIISLHVQRSNLKNIQEQQMTFICSVKTTESDVKGFFWLTFLKSSAVTQIKVHVFYFPPQYGRQELLKILLIKNHCWWTFRLWNMWNKYQLILLLPDHHVKALYLIFTEKKWICA